MRTTHTYKPKYSHSTSVSFDQNNKDSRRKGYREIMEAEEREWNAEEAVGEWGSISAKVMRTLESGQYQPETGRREMGLQGKFSFGQPGDRSRQGANHGGQMVVQPKRMMVQRAAQPLTGDSLTDGDSMRAVSSKNENKTGLPDRLKAGIENLSGYSMDDVRVHYNSEKPAQLQALAYAQGTDIHVGPGQEKHLAHEAWHVVQQKQGRVNNTIQAMGEYMIEEEGLEREADVMGRKVLDLQHMKYTNVEPPVGRKSYVYRADRAPLQRVKKEDRTVVQNSPQQLDYKKGSGVPLHSERVGYTMTARLNPMDPQQGSGPYARKGDLYDNLRDSDGVRLYIKGHLLNGKLGGPGVEDNLFPITAKANRDHSQQVEEPLKEKVKVLYYLMKRGFASESSYIRYGVRAVPEDPKQFHLNGSSKLICTVVPHIDWLDEQMRQRYWLDFTQMREHQIRSIPETIKTLEDISLEQIGWGQVGGGLRSGPIRINRKRDADGNLKYYNVQREVEPDGKVSIVNESPNRIIMQIIPFDQMNQLSPFQDKKISPPRNNPIY
ncbi:MULTISPECIES: DUF4157 domain-containing protein [unclassified Moorena]|uniref:eCIS core domain-containing protein n=1 Tax=unclassified Moorena TaxID=2683338 RepID=UPI00257D7330|nr:MULTISPECIES: DUF4157 domain-containing protein [unclassified Moorena]